ncbi:NAD-dependent epimerase/dehydratase family protein [Sporomusa acidovorans]|uniref:UDP-glucose 4-epimerase n=1 Tax=Sporomusa acidovorans (strain ATCC 49682 / DSM 3132 / Mol) TaxID=1123286 RepID=A0ABZ3J5F4_SPOA4|nr:NAD(P)-dependent oxidoreductase [Sporomusa acidovorans]OZC15373.1 UDP-glucose 4-epimerase [Sporomusa acidovorans DSM 3132]SDF13958.1 UDP-glucose 4-epimerase [Sporomusa acidovorans]
MRVLLVGGAGSVGQNLSEYLYQQGHTVTVADKNIRTFAQKKPDVATCVTDLTDRVLLRNIVAGNEIVVNLAWSFSDKPEFLFEHDIVDHINLLHTCANAGVKRFIYTSTAGIYGSPPAQPVDEAYFCRPEQARKPLYAVAKLCAEQLALVLGRQHNLPVSVFRFWWAFGNTIGGKHLRELIRLALNGQPLRMVKGSDGTFVTVNDIGRALELTASRLTDCGNTYNLGSLFLAWEEIGQTIIELTQSTSKLQLVDPNDWDGPAFLNETWHLSWDRAGREIGYAPLLDEGGNRNVFRQALANCIKEVANR